MAVNEILAFADSATANVISQSAYAALTNLINNGFVTGIANSNQMNKVLKQATLIAASVAQFIANQGFDVHDSDSPATIATNLSLAAQFASGTRVLFQQAAAPTGWTRDTTPSLHDRALRLVTSSSPTTGGSQAFTAVFTNQLHNTSGTAITTAQMPPHAHNITVTDPSHIHTLQNFGAVENVPTGVSGFSSITNNTGLPPVQTNPAFTGISAVMDQQGGGQTHNHTYQLDLEYCDAIICSKN